MVIAFALALALASAPSSASPITTDMLVEAADLFNASLFRRTVEGVARALGAPLVSIVPLSGVNSELVLTFAWEITWYQYRVLPEAGQPIRLADRGADISEIEAAFTDWNAQLEESGRVVPNAAR